MKNVYILKRIRSLRGALRQAQDKLSDVAICSGNLIFMLKKTNILLDRLLHSLPVVRNDIVCYKYRNFIIMIALSKALNIRNLKLFTPKSTKFSGMIPKKA